MQNGFGTVAEKTTWHTGRFDALQHFRYFLFILLIYIAYVYGVNLMWKVFYQRFINVRIVLRAITQQYKALFGKTFNDAHNTRKFCCMVVLSCFKNLADAFQYIQ